MRFTLCRWMRHSLTAGLLIWLVAGTWLAGKPLQAQDDDGLATVVAAYEAYATWETYTAMSSYSHQLALTLNTSDVRLNQTQSTRRYFDGQYAVADSAVQGSYTQAGSRRLSLGSADTDTTELNAEFEVIGLPDDIYVRGDVLFRTAGETREAAYDTYTPFAESIDDDDLLAMLELQHVADYTQFRDIDAFIELVANAEEIEGPRTASIRQFRGELTFYTLTLDAAQALDILNIDLDNLLSTLLETRAISERALRAAIADDSTLQVSVFLDEVSGRLVAENLVLTFDIEISGEALVGGDEDSLLIAEYSYEQLSLYEAVNEPVRIDDPTPDDPRRDDS